MAIEMTEKDVRRLTFESKTGKKSLKNPSWFSGMLRANREEFDAEELRREYPGLKIHGI